jgi:4-oxalocrotonate tautomerase
LEKSHANGECPLDRRRFHASQKQEMIRKLTDAMVSIEGENMRQVTWVIIDEVKSGDWGLGGEPLTTNDVKALAAGTPKG